MAKSERPANDRFFPDSAADAMHDEISDIIRSYSSAEGCPALLTWDVNCAIASGKLPARRSSIPDSKVPSSGTGMACSLLGDDIPNAAPTAEVFDAPASFE